MFLPEGPGPHLVAVLNHGGCWSATSAGHEHRLGTDALNGVAPPGGASHP